MLLRALEGVRDPAVNRHQKPRIAATKKSPKTAREASRDATRARALGRAEAMEDPHLSQPQKADLGALANLELHG
jgi:hypothetical protein